ncbi:hypothetical protein KCU71_g4383, partial [Aureobasidium melanogenum]
MADPLDAKSLARSAAANTHGQRRERFVGTYSQVQRLAIPVRTAIITKRRVFSGLTVAPASDSVPGPPFTALRDVRDETPPSVTPKPFVIQALENARDFHHSAQDSFRAAEHTGNHAQYTLRAAEDADTHAQDSLHTAEDTVNHTEHSPTNEQSPINDEIESQQSPTNDDDSPALLSRHGTKRKGRVSDSSEPTTAAAQITAAAASTAAAPQSAVAPQSATDVARDS